MLWLLLAIPLMAWPIGVPKNMTPQQRVERARNAALARTTVDHHITALAGKALTHEHRARLAELIKSSASAEVSS